MAAVEWNWKESPWGAGSVQIESTCRSQLKGFVLFWLSGSIDTSYINLSKNRIKCSTGGPRLKSFLTHVTRWQLLLSSVAVCWTVTRLTFDACSRWLIREQQTTNQEEDIWFVVADFFFFCPYCNIMMKEKIPFFHSFGTGMCAYCV